MDIFPVALTNRDMQTLMRVIEEWGETGPFGTIPDDLPEIEDPEDIDAVKSRVAQMSSQEMSRFLRAFEEGINASRRILEEDIMIPGDLGYIEALRGLRQAAATVHSLRGRIRRSR